MIKQKVYKAASHPHKSSSGSRYSTIDYVVNTYLFGLLIHSVTIRGLKWGQALTIELEEKRCDKD